MTQPVRKLAPMPDGAMSELEWAGPGGVKGAPLLHFAHATGFNAETYQSLLAPLSERFHIHASDARGHGLTVMGVAPGQPKGWTIYRDDLLRFLDDIGGKPLILAGHSMGAVVSLMTAVVRPDLVRGLVLIEPVFVPAAAMRLANLLHHLHLRRQEPSLADRAERRRDTFASIDAAFDAYRGRGAFRTWPEETIRDYLDGGMILDTKTGFAHLTCTPAWEADTFRGAPLGAAKLARLVRCPVTLIHGAQGTAPASEVKRFLDFHPKTRVVKVEGATHFLPMEFPDVVRDEINRLADFLRPHVATAKAA
ncbi:MAG TPA: alpha/beta hydrolase [Rhizomicrobium sp.]|jgi:pimeloyl-ACP methyl ester carboxylesterase